MAPTLPPTTPEYIRLTFAPIYFGSILSWLFFGFVATQFYIYTTTRPNDTIGLKLMVYFVMLILTINMGTETYSGYAALVAGWGDLIIIEKVSKPLMLGPIFKAIVAFCVQNFYAWRIWAFLQRKVAASLFCAVMVSLSLLQLAGGIGVPIVFFSVNAESDFSQKAIIFNDIWLVGGLVNDILITATMVVILRDAQSSIIMQQTKTRLGKLIRLSIQTGALTVLLATATLILSHFLLSTGLFQLFPAYLIEPSYALSLLCNLNINSGQAKNNTTKSSFYVQPSTINFSQSRDYGYQSRKPETPRNQGAFELSLRSNPGGPVLSDVSHITIGKPGFSSHDTSNIHVESVYTTSYS